MKPLPDPTGKSVIILVGKNAGQEGYCLGPAGTENLYAVTPKTSNHILQLKFDKEFGILINPGQEKGEN